MDKENLTFEDLMNKDKMMFKIANKLTEDFMDEGKIPFILINK